MRYKKCSCGIMVTASHNPPSDNAVKVYWSTGGQLLPPHDQGVIERVMSDARRFDRVPFAEAVADGQVVYLPGGSRRGVRRGGAGAELRRARAT